MKFITLAFMVSLSLSNSMSGERELVRVIRVVDGDTIVVSTDDGHEKVRFIGIDTPETYRTKKAKKEAHRLGVSIDDIQRAASKASSFTNSIIGDFVSIEKHGRDMYGRILAYVYISDGRCINEILVEYGYAKSAFGNRYDALEMMAREKRIGFWRNIWERD